LFDTADILAAIEPGVDLVVVSAVVFTTGQIIDGLAEIVARAHAVGARVVVDAYHAAGVIPLLMDDLGCDFMVGGSYKYTRGGTGSCWLAIHPRSMDLRTLDTGWFAKKDVWSYARPEEPVRAEGGDGWLESTPAILPFYQARSGLEFTLEIGVDRLREYSLVQLAELREAFRRNAVPFFDPADPTQFGGFALTSHADAKAFRQALFDAGVNTDTRSGNVRFGPDLLNSMDELHRAAEITARRLAR
jgi:kynureninase